MCIGVPQYPDLTSADEKHGAENKQTVASPMRGRGRHVPSLVGMRRAGHRDRRRLPPLLCLAVIVLGFLTECANGGKMLKIIAAAALMGGNRHMMLPMPIPIPYHETKHCPYHVPVPVHYPVHHHGHSTSHHSHLGHITSIVAHGHHGHGHGHHGHGHYGHYGHGHYGHGYGHYG